MGRDRQRGSAGLKTSSVLALLLVLASLLLPVRASAAPPPGVEGQQRPVIVAGREAEIQALFAPHQLGGEISPGWTLHSFNIDVGTITVWLAGENEQYAKITLDHLDYGPPDAQRLTGFAAKVAEQPPGSEAATAELLAIVERNDAGKFWGTEVVYAGEPRKYEYEFLGSQLATELRLWLHDGLLLLAFIVVALALLVRHELREAPRWIKLALPVVVLVGAVLRLWLSPKVGLDPWSYTRVIEPAGRIYGGPALALLHPEPAYITDVITHSTLAYALLAPLAVFVHACELLEDKRVALLVAVLVAVLPLHLRFSHSDTGFIASLTIASTVFTLLYVATRTPGKLGGWLAVATFAIPLLLLYKVRPLNMLYFPMLLVTPFIAQGLSTDKPPLQWPRVIVCALIVCVLTFGWGLPWLLASFADNVSEGLSIRTLESAVKVIFSPRFNALLNPVFTPPGLTVLAIIGIVDLWRRRRRWLLAYVAAWYLGFLVAHSYIIPGSPYMQARYHLHLVMPYMMMVACGAWAGLQWLRDNSARVAWLRNGRDKWVIGGVAAYALASPLIHMHGITNVAFNDQQEWLFVHDLRDEIPAECTILEYTGLRAGPRFARVGASIERGIEQQRWTVVEIPQAEPGEPEIPEDARAVLEDPPECLYWYEGLPCAGYKPIDEFRAPVCHAIEGFVALEEVARTEFDSEPYDENLAHGLGERDHIELRLFRAYRKPSE